MLEALRGKRMLFVGDSLGRGQFASMVCLLHSAIPGGGGSSLRMSPDQQHTVFAAGDYDTTVEFYWAPFLLESNSDNAVVHGSVALKLLSLPQTQRQVSCYWPFVWHPTARHKTRDLLHIFNVGELVR